MDDSLISDQSVAGTDGKDEATLWCPVILLLHLRGCVGQVDACSVTHDKSDGDVDFLDCVFEKSNPSPPRYRSNAKSTPTNRD